MHKENLVINLENEMEHEQIQNHASISSTTLRAPRKHHILCVDDDILGTGLRGEILEEHGYSVTLYHCPLAVLTCDLFAFDLAVIDFQMPRLNGHELLLRMRALGARFPTLLLTGCLDALSREERALFTRCIEKSRPIGDLLKTIAGFLDPHEIPD